MMGAVIDGTSVAQRLGRDSAGQWRRRQFLAALLMPVLGGCQLEDIPHMITAPRASAHFSDVHLQLAQAIERGDLATLERQGAIWGPDVLSRPDRSDMTLMWFAIVRQRFDAVRVLVKLGVDPDTQGAQGLGTAVAFCFATRRDPTDRSGIELFQAMLDGGFPVEHRTPGGTPLIVRAVSGSIEHLQLLLDRGADINAVDSLGRNGLHEASNIYEPKTMLYLIKRGIRIDQPTINGVTPLWSVYLKVRDQIPGPVRDNFIMVRDAMIARGAKWPPDPPEVVRKQMRAQGLRVVD